MTAWRQAIELAIGEKDLAQLGAIARSRTEPASCVERARMLLAYREDPSFQADPRQSFRTHLQGNQGLARRSTCWPLRIRLHAQAWLLAQSHRGLFLQARSL